MRSIRFSLVFFVALAATVCTRKESSKPKQAWDPITNLPEKINFEPLVFEYDFFKLPTQGMLDQKPWSEDYWPSSLGGVSRRWLGASRNASPSNFNYVSPTADAVRTMSLEDKKKLSPAEKYSIFVGDYSYKLVSEERERVMMVPGANGSMSRRPGNPWDIPSWEGLCHAWTPASVFFTEPNPIVLKGAGDIEVPFGASDIKALLMRLTHEDAGNPGDMIFSRSTGGQCNFALGSPDFQNAPECRDANPGTFHVVIANRIGVKKLPVFADLKNGADIWNYPVFGYETQLLSMRSPRPGAAVDAAKEIVVRTRLHAATEVHPSWEKTGTVERSAAEATYVYSLELDASDRVIGGEWLQADVASLRFNQLSDYTTLNLDNLWMRGRPRFSWATQPDKWRALEKIYNAATAAN